MTILMAGLTAGCSTPAKPERRGEAIVLRSVATTQSNITTVVLRKDQSLFIKGQPVAFNDLARELEAAGSGPSHPVVLQAEPQTPYAAVVKVIDLLKKAGYTNLSLVANKEVVTRKRATTGKPAAARKK